MEAFLNESLFLTWTGWKIQMSLNRRPVSVLWYLASACRFSASVLGQIPVFFLCFLITPSLFLCCSLITWTAFQGTKPCIKDLWTRLLLERLSPWSMSVLWTVTSLPLWKAFIVPKFGKVQNFLNVAYALCVQHKSQYFHYLQTLFENYTGWMFLFFPLCLWRNKSLGWLPGNCSLPGYGPAHNTCKTANCRLHTLVFG